MGNQIPKVSSDDTAADEHHPRVVVRAKSIYKGNFSTGDSTVSEEPTTDDSVSTVLNQEPCLLDPSDEKQGVNDIWEALTQEERDALPDPQMTLRYFRAEKVCLFS